MFFPGVSWAEEDGAETPRPGVFHGEVMEEREAWAVGSWGFGVGGGEKGHVISRQVRVCGFLSSLAGLLSPSSFASTSSILSSPLPLPFSSFLPFLPTPRVESRLEKEGKSGAQEPLGWWIGRQCGPFGCHHQGLSKVPTPTRLTLGLTLLSGTALRPLFLPQPLNFPVPTLPTSFTSPCHSTVTPGLSSSGAALPSP